MQIAKYLISKGAIIDPIFIVLINYSRKVEEKTVIFNYLKELNINRYELLLNEGTPHHSNEMINVMIDNNFTN